MSDDPWMDKRTFMAHVDKSERTVQLWVKHGKVERQMLDGKAYYRKAPLHPVTVLRPPDTPPWAVELLEEIRALRAELAVLTPSPPEPKALEVNTPPAAERNTVTPPQRGWLARLLSKR